MSTRFMGEIIRITSYGIVCMILIENSMPLKSFNRPSDSGADLLSSVPAERLGEDPRKLLLRVDGPE